MKIIIIIFLLSLNTYGQNLNEGSFAPLPGGKYVVSGWVQEDYGTTQKKAYSSYIRIKFLQGTFSLPTGTKDFFPSGAVIDGWQRIVGIIDIPAFPNPTDNPSIVLELICGVTGIDCYFDDIRFFPYNGSLKSFVYDEQTKRLLAELDENNYSTFYEYDLEGGLIRVKKETEEGVYTIQETRSGNVKK
ncbi:MAG: hypothetical protein V4548_08025 [Bacteroidota bacterium]